MSDYGDLIDIKFDEFKDFIYKFIRKNYPDVEAYKAAREISLKVREIVSEQRRRAYYECGIKVNED